jgi:MFS family permease
VLRSLRHRNFRLFLTGQMISLTGTWMQQVAMSWLAYRWTRSPLVLGLFGFASQLPAFFLAPVGGVLADRVSRRRLVMATQVLSMLQAATLAALVLTNHTGVGGLLVLTAFLGLVNGIDIPVRQAFLVEMVNDKSDLPNAIALNSSAFNAARLVGPALGGFVVAAVGEGVAFLLNALSYIAVIGALLALRLPSAPARPLGAPAVWSNLREGMRYAFGFPPIRTILLLVFTASLFGVPFLVLMPVFAADVMHGGPSTLGLLMGAVGVGALAGALTLAARRSVVGLGSMITIAIGVFGTGLLLFSATTSVLLALPGLFAAGFGMMALMASSNTILQTIVEDDKRGRVLSFYAMSFMGAVPVGSLLAGALAARIGAPATVRIGACVCLLSGLLYARVLPSMRAHVRPLYMRLGLLPDAAAVVEDVPLAREEDAAAR